MKFQYLKSTFKYLMDKGPFLMLINIVPCLMLPFLFSASDSIYFLFSYLDVDASNFANMYAQMRALPTDAFYIGIVGLVLFIFTASISLGAVDRHMKIGDFRLEPRIMLKRINLNLLSVLKTLVTILLIMEFINVLTGAFFYFFAVVTSSQVAWLVLSIISCAIMSIIGIFLCSAVILWPPYMLHTGLNTFESFKMAWKQISKSLFQVVIVQAVLLIPLQIATLIVAALGANWIAVIVLDGLSFTFMTTVYICLMYNIFYDVTGLERMDLQKENIWSKKVK